MLKAENFALMIILTVSKKSWSTHFIRITYSPSDDISLVHEKVLA